MKAPIRHFPPPPGRGFSRWIGWVWILAACTCSILAQVRVEADEKPQDVPPEARARIADYVKKVAAAQRKRLDQRMSERIEEIAKVTGLGPDGVKTLGAAAAQAEDAAQAEMMPKYTDALIHWYAQGGAKYIEQLDSPQGIEQAASQEFGASFNVNYRGAHEQPVWTEALAHTLTPEQAAAWEKAEAERKARATKEIGGALDAVSGEYDEMFKRQIAGRSAEIVARLDLPKDRADQVNALADKAADASTDAWRKGAMDSLLSADEATLKDLLATKRFVYGFKSEDAPLEQPVWKDGIQKLLTDGERERLKAGEESEKTERLKAAGQLLVALLDEKIAFTSAQRPLLEPVARRLAEGMGDSLAPNGNNYYAISVDLFYQAAAAVKPEDIRNILDDVQFKHWQDIGQAKDASQEEDGNFTFNPAPARPGPSPAAPGEPEDMELAVSDLIRSQADAHYEQESAVMILKAEDATRIAKLSSPVAARLQTAARGAAEEQVAGWVTFFGQNVRSQLIGATPENLAQKLAISRRFLMGRQRTPVSAIWKAATDADLTQPQRDAWQVELDARSHYNEMAIAGFLVAEFGRKFALTPDQSAKLLPMIATAVRDYRDDISQMFAYGYQSPWYLTSYSMSLPFLALPENDLKGLLTPRQWDLWTGSSDFATSASYWQNIQSMHNSQKPVRKKS